MSAVKEITFEQVYAHDCSQFIEKKKSGNTELSYLSWAYAWAHFQKFYPEATYEVKKFDGVPYVCDASVGIMVYTSVTAAGKTHEMWLPVMDGANKAMKLEPYTYTVKDFRGGYVEKAVAAATMFDINKTIMRCLVKNLAMFGLGLSIYAGEDIPQPLTDDENEALVHEVKSRKPGKSKPQEAQPQQPERKLQRITLEMVTKGQCKSIIEHLAKAFDQDMGVINPETEKEVRGWYAWDQDAINEVINRAIKK